MFYLNENKSYNDIKRGIIIPKKSEKLAELYGVITGDGYIGIYKDKNGIIDHYFLEISGNKTLDFDYLSNYVSNLFIELFNLKPTLVIKKNSGNAIYLRIGSKAIVCFFRDLGFPLGKKGDIIIPNWILENERYVFNFLAGYFDTDGSVILTRRINGFYPSLGISSKSKPLILQTKQILEKLFDFPINFWKDERDDKRGFKSIVYKLRINGPKRIGMVTNLIKIHNRRHTDKIAKI